MQCAVREFVEGRADLIIVESVAAKESLEIAGFTATPSTALVCWTCEERYDRPHLRVTLAPLEEEEPSAFGECPKCELRRINDLCG